MSFLNIAFFQYLIKETIVNQFFCINMYLSRCLWLSPHKNGKLQRAFPPPHIASMFWMPAGWLTGVSKKVIEYWQKKLQRLIMLLHMHFRLARGVAAWVCLPWLNIIRPGNVVVGGNSFSLVEYYQLMVIECFLFSSHWLSFLHWLFQSYLFQRNFFFRQF